LKSPHLSIAAAAIALALSLSPIAPAAQRNDRPVTGTQATMQQLFRDLSVVFRLSLDEGAYQNPDNHDQILSALYALAGNAEQLGAQGDGGLDQCFDFRQSSLVRDANEAVMRFRQGQYEGSRFLLAQLMNNCFSCHSMLPADRPFQLGERFLEETAVETLTPEDRVRLQVTVRQFDAALDTFEELFASPTVSAVKIATSGAFENYLKVCVRVEDDCGRAIATLERFRVRPDVPPYLDGRLRCWAADLRELDKPRRSGRDNPLERGRRLIRDAQYRNTFPNDPQGTVWFVAASGCIYRFLLTNPTEDRRRAEAYYLLGVAESHTSASYWQSETDHLLELSIRTAPKSVYARMAYNFLEEYTISGYTGSSGVNVPTEVQSHLDELRALVGGGENP
jgi:hypothetical protein